MKTVCFSQAKSMAMAEVKSIRKVNEKLSEQIAKMKIEVEQCATRDQAKSDIIIKPVSD